MELWKTDGTANGTQLVQDLRPGSGSQPVTGNNGWDDNGYGISVGKTYFFYGNNGSQLGLFGTNADGSVVPVRLLYFSGGVVNGQAVLNWATAREEENEGFSVLKSHDALGWESIGFVAGKGESNQQQNYTFTDTDVLPGQVWYYKLRQRDHNGHTEDSKVIAVKIELGAGRSWPFPNPSPDGSFRLTAQVATSQTIHLFTLSGQEIAVQTSQTTPDADVVVMPRQMLAAGAYVVKLTDDAGVIRAFTLVVEQ